MEAEGEVWCLLSGVGCVGLHLSVVCFRQVWDVLGYTCLLTVVVRCGMCWITPVCCLFSSGVGCVGLHLSADCCRQVWDVLDYTCLLTVVVRCGMCWITPVC